MNYKIADIAWSFRPLCNRSLGSNVYLPSPLSPSVAIKNACLGSLTPFGLVCLLLIKFVDEC